MQMIILSLVSPIRAWVVLLPFVLVVGLIAAGCGNAEQPLPPQAARLPDGTEIRLETTTYGKQHQSKFVNTTYNYSFEQDTLIFWASLRGGPPESAYSFTDQVAFDEHGCQISLGRLSLRKTESADAPTVVIFRLDVFPRRGRTVGLRLYGEDDKKPVAELAAPNPTPGPYPNWKPESYPITKNDGDLSVALTGLNVNQTPGPGQRPTVGTTLRLSRNNQPSGDWEPVRLIISDATGNEIPWEFQRSLTRGSLMRSDEAAMTIVGSLCLEESAWKIRAELTPIAGTDVAPKETWVVRNATVPKREQIIRSTETTKRQGMELALIGLAGPGIVQWTPQSSRSHPDTEVRLGMSLPHDGVRPTLQATDDQGRKLDGYTQGFTDNPDENMRIYSFFLKVPSDAKTLTLRFDVHKGRFFEFLAKPSPSK